MNHIFKTYFSNRVDVRKFVLIDEIIVIEYRSRLKTFDLIYHPNLSSVRGPARFIDAVKIRSTDYLKLCAIVIQTFESARRPDEIKKELMAHRSKLIDNPCA